MRILFASRRHFPIIREYGRLDTEEYRDDGIYVEAAVPAAYVGKVMG